MGRPGETDPPSIAYFAGIVALRPFAPFIRVMEAAFVAVVLVVFAQADAVVT